MWCRRESERKRHHPNLSAESSWAGHGEEEIVQRGEKG